MAVDRRTEDVRLEAQRVGQMMAVIGWTILVVAIIGGIFVFQTYREGTYVWRYLVYAMGLVGAVLIFLGSRKRRVNS